MNTGVFSQNMSDSEIQICANCVMDTTDNNIQFDSNGVCDHCNGFFKNILPKWNTDEHGRIQLEQIVAAIKRNGRGRDFDCLIGMSGGADSSYLLHLAVEDLGLKPLVFHVDGGWNSKIAVNNIEVLIDKLKLDLFTEVIDWEEMKDFQLSYFKSGLPNIDVPQDHAFVATLYNFAEKNRIRYILNGGNYSTECVRNPLDWLYYGTDMAQIRDVRKRFGTIQLRTYPFSSVLRHKIYLRYMRQVQVVKPLNYLPYIKSDAMEFLKRKYGWQPYPQKHFESRFTRFYEGYWLPEKFGFDTRKVQYSSLILTGQMSRKEALRALSQPALLPEEAKVEFEFVATKLGISTSELRGYFDGPNMSHRDYRNSERMFNLGARLMQLVGLETAIKR